MKINPDGCPCSNDCCDKPKIYCPEHEEPDDHEDVCQECFRNVCLSCDSGCYCAL